MSDLERKLGELVNDAMATNDAASAGATHNLAGLTVVKVEIEVWSSEGETAFKIELSDGSMLECPGLGYFYGPVANLVRMAGGYATYEEFPYNREET